MKVFKTLLLIGIIFYFSITKIDSFYKKFFEYGDVGHDGKLSKQECHDHPNGAFSMECRMVWKKMPAALQNKEEVTKEEFRDMAIPGGIKYFHIIYIKR